jgi:hypothetical protein
LILEQLPSTAVRAQSIGPYYSGIAAFAGAAVAMIVGSLIKPMFVTDSVSEANL